MNAEFRGKTAVCSNFSVGHEIGQLSYSVSLAVMLNSLHLHITNCFPLLFLSFIFSLHCSLFIVNCITSNNNYFCFQNNSFMPDVKKQLNLIKAFAFDVDGVFTNGSVMLHPGGEFIRMMNIKDGYAIQHAVKMGYPIAIISGGYSKMVKKRFEYLGVKDIYMKSGNKISAFQIFLRKVQPAAF